MPKGDNVGNLKEIASGESYLVRPPSTDQWIIHNIYRGGTADINLIHETDVTGESVGTGDGTTTTFNLANDNIVQYSEKVYIDGVLQTSGTDYTIDYATGAITFTTAPASGASITADYTYFDKVLIDGGNYHMMDYFIHLTYNHYLEIINTSPTNIVVGYDGIVSKSEVV